MGEIKGKSGKEPDKPCASVDEIGSTLLSSLLKKGGNATKRRKYKKSETNDRRISYKKYSRGVECEEKKVKRTRKKKSKREKGKVELDEALRLQRRARYLLIKMKWQQNLIDAYATEGWKGQSREKIRPDKELERARKQILNCKLGLREAIHQLDLLSSVGSIEEKVMAPDGSIHHEHIFCAECNSREAFLDNDIILCDGTCNRAFHQKCLDPPLDTENIPPGDQGWFCKFCVCKMEIIDSMNAQTGTHFPADSYWQDIFKEEANLPNGSEATLNNEVDWPSDDSEDDDYDPEMKEIDSLSLSCDGENGEISSNSLSLSSDGEALLTNWELEMENEGNNTFELGETSNEEVIVSGTRQRRTVDYTKLYYDMFGKDAVLHEQGSEDEDWGPSNRRKRKKEFDSATTVLRLCESSKKDQDNVELPEFGERDSMEDKGRKPSSRLPRAAVEKLRRVFAENELPSKTVRDELSKELNLDPEKVSKWFKNARYMALRNRKTENLQQPQNPKAVSGDSGPERVKENIIETNETQESIDEENLLLGMDDSCTNQDQISPVDNLEDDQKAKENVFTPAEEQEHEKEQEQEEDEEQEEDLQSSDELRGDMSLEMAEEKTSKEEEVIYKEAMDMMSKAQNMLKSSDELSGDMSPEMTEKTASKEYEVYEAAMEMICRAQNMLLDMKVRLNRLKPQRKSRKKLGKSVNLTEEEKIVYVPIAEIKER